MKNNKHYKHRGFIDVLNILSFMKSNICVSKMPLPKQICWDPGQQGGWWADLPFLTFSGDLLA